MVSLIVEFTWCPIYFFSISFQKSSHFLSKYIVFYQRFFVHISILTFTMIYKNFIEASVVVWWTWLTFILANQVASSPFCEMFHSMSWFSLKYMHIRSYYCKQQGCCLLRNNVTYMYISLNDLLKSRFQCIEYAILLSQKCLPSSPDVFSIFLIYK